MPEKVKVGIAGLGRSGWNIHANILDKLRDKYEVVAVTDPLEDRRREAVKRFECKASVSYTHLTLPTILLV